MLESRLIKELAEEVGFDLCGIARATHLQLGEQAFLRWLERGYDSSLGYMRRNLDKRFDVRQLIEGAQSVVVCGVSYRSEISGGYDGSHRAKVASYACNRDYHKSVKRMLKNLMQRLQQVDPSLEGRAFVDSAPLLEKQLAVEAGLGWIGRQSLVVTPQYGSMILLGELVLCSDVDCYDEPIQSVGCGECRRCVEACPTGAIVEDMVIDTSRCISCRTIESEADCRIDLNGWIFGCEECQNICPYNRRAPQHRAECFDPTFDPRTISPEQWLAMDEEEFEQRFGSTPLKRSGLARLQRNVERNMASAADEELSVESKTSIPEQ